MKNQVAFHRSMPIAEIVTFCPAAKSILAEYGLHCFSCAGSEFETLELGCRGHGMEDDEINELVDDLNSAYEAMPERPMVITVTLPAARAVRSIAESEGRINEGLAVIADATGGFCMEFRAEPEEGDQVFAHPEEPTVRVFASTMTLRRVGGATIDFREERFKLDLPEDSVQPDCGCTKATCGCKAKGA